MDGAISPPADLVLRASASGFQEHLARQRKIARRRHLADAALLALSF